MKLEDAARRVEQMFTVHHEAGMPTSYQDQYGKDAGEGPRDSTRAPNGERYTTISSFGVDAMLPEDVSALFSSSGLAASWWFDEVTEHAKTIEPDRDLWPKLHLYWRTQPTFQHTKDILRVQCLCRTRLDVFLGSDHTPVRCA